MPAELLVSNSAIFSTPCSRSARAASDPRQPAPPVTRTVAYRDENLLGLDRNVGVGGSSSQESGRYLLRFSPRVRIERLPDFAGQLGLAEQPESLVSFEGSTL